MTDDRMTDDRSTDARAHLDRTATAFQDSAVLLAANHLGLTAALCRGPRRADALAADLGLDARATETLLLALVGQDVAEQPRPGLFAVTPAFAPYLDPDGDQSLRSILDHNHHLLQRWARLADVVRTGEPAPRPSGEDGRRDPAELRAFICGMKDISRRSSVQVADALPELGDCRHLLDLGGGPGTAAITFCRRWPTLRAVVMDLPEVVPIAAAEIAAAGLEDRVTTLAGDYHQDRLRSGDSPLYDAVYVANIIHSLSPEETRSVLGRAVRALADGGLLVVKDFYLEDSRTEPAFAARFSVNMLVGTAGGKSYTWRETEDLLRELGLGRLERHRVAAHSGLVVGRKGTP